MNHECYDRPAPDCPSDRLPCPFGCTEPCTPARPLRWWERLVLNRAVRRAHRRGEL